MPKVSLTINGKTVITESENTLLQAAAQEGIFIPTLCHNPLLKPEEACRICVVEVKGEPRPVASCSFKAAEGLEVQTDTATIREYRKNILSLLLEQHYGDCVAPCHMTCPGKLDIQGYVAHIARGNYIESLRMIKEKTPFAATLGRVCPHPCENECSRTRVEEAINIKDLKRYVADYAAERKIRVTPKPPADTGKKVAIIGGGPAGLAAAYYLRLKGHAATIYDAMPKLGGMLRYGIPEYRLPKAVLDEEIQEILDLGVEVIANKKFGKDFTLASLKSQGYDAIFLAVGAWNSYKLGIPGEDLPGVMSAIEFLIRTASGDPPPVGKKVIIIGNGNTGMDAARSCLRMGAKEVIMLYRRTKAEMPANPQEIHDAEQEGIKIHILATPTRIVSKDGRFSGVEYLENELKAADSSGRPSPVPIKGSETIIEADQAIVSIGQFSDMAFLKNDSELKDIAFTKKGIPETDSNTLQSCLPYLFLGGDLLRGPRTVIQASADGREAALSIHSYLTDGVVIKDAKPFNITKGKLKEVDPVNFENIISRPRHSTPLLSVEQRVKSFEEAELVLTESQAKAEAERCLSCGCLDSFDCLLRKYATIYNVDASKLTFWKSPKYKIENSHPFITVDPNKCIVCRRCAVGCDNYQIQYAIKVDEVSSENRIGPPQYAPNINDKCVDCGLCAGNCPTGALQEKIKGKPGPFELKKIRTTCTYCGVGCQIYLGVSGGEVVNVEGVSGVAPNFGHLCVKGRFAYDFIHSPERLRYPMIKQDDGSFRQASWEEALDLVARQLSSVRDEYGPDTIGALTSARVTNEENYLFQKLARAVFKTNNVDHCARLCHASTVAGLAAAFGSGAMTNTIGDIEEADVILLTGSNITENHPVISSNIKRAIKFKGTKLIVVDPRRINMTYFSRNWLRQNLGTDVAWINGMMHVIIKEELFDKSFVENRTTNFEELTKAVKKYTPEYVESITGIPSQSLIDAARLYAGAKAGAIVYCMGITQHTTGTDNVKSLANLAMLCGNLGIRGGGVNPLRGQNNVQGACDMGGLPDVFSGYQKVIDPAVREKMEQAWGVSGLPDKPGLKATEMMPKAHDKSLRALYIIGENPLVSDPDINHAEKCIKNLDFLVVQDIFMTDTAKLADVVLPSACFAEKEGTFTNTERRVQRVRKAVDPPGQAQEDWKIICEIANRMGCPMAYESSEAIMEEISQVTPSYSGINYERIDQVGVHWPCTSIDHPGTPILHTQTFPIGKGVFHAIEYIPPAEQTDNEYPLYLTTGRLIHQYHTGTMTMKSDGINQRAPENFVEISSSDAKKFGVEDGTLAKIVSRRGDITATIKISTTAVDGTVFIPFHFAQSAANKLTNAALDPVSKIPEYKVCAVAVEKS